MQIIHVIFFVVICEFLLFLEAQVPKDIKIFLQLQLKAVYAILLAAVLGFGMSISLNSLYMRYFAWRVQVPQNPSPV